MLPCMVCKYKTCYFIFNRELIDIEVVLDVVCMYKIVKFSGCERYVRMIAVRRPQERLTLKSTTHYDAKATLVLRDVLALLIFVCRYSLICCSYYNNGRINLLFLQQKIL